MSNGLFTSKKNYWETPKELYEELDREFAFTLDICASKENAKCIYYCDDYSKNGAGVRDIHGDLVEYPKEWDFKDILSEHCVFMNPPYGREIKELIQAAYDDSKYATFVCLVPARTDTKWWNIFYDHENHRPREGVEIRFLKGRLKFELNGVAGDAAPFPSAIVIMSR